ncbi:hypothetical protein G6F43_007325 [Rhizopus delemar]|nr:hypothetical protein G6F43_007325 [Rhizopus delemar]
MMPEDFHKCHETTRRLQVFLRGYPVPEGSIVAARWFPEQQQQQISSQSILQSQATSKPLQPAIKSQQTQIDDLSPVGGRLSQFSAAWTQLSASYLLNNIIKDGFKLHFQQLPPLSNHPIPIVPYSADQIPLLHQTIQDLLSKEAIEKVTHPSPGYYSSIFVIPKKDKGLRPVFNLKRLNHYLKAPHFKMETLKEVSLLIQPRDYLTSIDFSDAFLHIPVHSDYTFRLTNSPLALNQDLPSYIGVGTSTGHTDQRIYRRLGYHFEQSRNLSQTDGTSTPAIDEARLEDQLVQIDPDTYSTIGSPWLPIEHYHHDSTVTTTKNSGHPPIYTTGIKQSCSITSCDPQSHYANTGRHLCIDSGEIVHSPVVDVQESSSQASAGLGHSDSTDGAIQGQATMVEQQSEQVERPVDSSNQPDRDNLCGRERFGLGMPLPSTEDSRILDTPGGQHVNQLEGAESSPPCITIISSAPSQNNSFEDRQHHLPQSHQQVWGDSGTGFEHISNGTLDMVSSTRDHDSSTTCSRKRQRHCRSGIQTHVHEKSLANTSTTFSPPSTTPGSSLCRFICRQNDSPITKVGRLETRPGSDRNRCVQFALEPISPSLGEPALEPDHENTTQDTTGPGSSNNSSSAALDQCTVVSTPSASCNFETNNTVGQAHQVLQSTDPLSSREILETIRLATLREKFVNIDLSMSAQQLVTGRLTKDSPTTKTFKHTHLAQPRTLANDPILQAFFTALCASTAPVLIHRPTVDLTPTITYLQRIDSNTCTLRCLQQKTAFLLAMAAFLRPSDLSRIELTSAIIDPNNSTLTFNIGAPKERRRGLKIIKPVMIYPHMEANLCPVIAYLALRDHQAVRERRPPSALFVNSRNPQTAIRTTTISSWLRQLVRLSTTETLVSERSLASSLVLRMGISREDIQTLGNWQSSATFETFYRCEHMTTVDFTNKLISTSAGTFPVAEILADTDSDEDEFYDANEA